MAETRAKKAALFVGGWEGHTPTVFCDWATALLEEEGFDVVSYGSFEPLQDKAVTAELDLIVPIWSSARSSHQDEFGNITREQEQGLLDAIAGGCGIAGWHGHMGDAFRDHPTYHFMIGGQFVAHPPGWPDNPVPSDDFVDYRVTFTKNDAPFMEGLEDFDIHGEQYYMLVDPSNDVVATTTFSGEYLHWIEGTVMPIAWRRRWDQGKVFYCSIGHTVEELKHPMVDKLMRKGFNWAAR
ncbi:ThuA domain-containing protein [Enterovibrio paralichthyis]|uniref:ThuA domain-containing protein n=1 Tax=Enterovibrio paralichthyis TaxID=2853805 RepID=UPI001C4964F0|nr:ThuA domain-containing protein [Enterovibrio paralichthyis]MBV7298327.1 ThuA domain-containing protein [Enterovibrio paralichthyis]